VGVPSKRNIFWRPSSKVNPPLMSNVVWPFVPGVTVPGTGVRLVHVAVAPSHSQTT
jgi:hypothetical protein